MGFISRSSKEPVGEIKFFGNATIPASYLPADGAAVSRTTFAQLFAEIGIAYGAGNGTTTFNVPDYRGRAPIGDGTGSGLTARTRGTNVGNETHTLAAVESGVASHPHAVTDSGHFHLTSLGDGNFAHFGRSGANQTDGGQFNSVFNGPLHNTETKSTGLSVNSASATAAASAHNNMQPSLPSKFGIKY